MIAWPTTYRIQWLASSARDPTAIAPTCTTPIGYRPADRRTMLDFDRAEEKRWNVLTIALKPLSCLIAFVVGRGVAAARWRMCAATGDGDLRLWEGGNVVPAECDALKDQRVVVVCRPPSSHEYRHAGASRNIAQRVSELLVDNLKGADIVNPREVDNWVDETDWGDFKELAHAVHADKVVLHRAEQLRPLQRQDAVPRPGRRDGLGLRHEAEGQDGLGPPPGRRCFTRTTAASRLKTSRCSNSSTNSTTSWPVASPNTSTSTIRTTRLRARRDGESIGRRAIARPSS